jgi:hypothetical protein
LSLKLAYVAHYADDLVKRFWEFIEAGTGKYHGRYKAEDGRQLSRFDEPEDKTYPAMIEIFSRKPAGIDLRRGAAHRSDKVLMRIPPVSRLFC